MKSVREIPSRPSAFATSASVRDDFSKRVEAGDRTDAPEGPVREIPLKAVPAEPSIALTGKFPAVAESVVTITFCVPCVEEREKAPSESVKV